MVWNSNFGYGDVVESSGLLPEVGKVERVKVIKAEAKVVGDNQKPVVRLFGAFPDFDEDARWSATVFLPLDEGDADRYQRDVKTFLKILKAFGAPDPRGMSAEQIADGLIQKFARAKVCAPYGDGDVFDAKFFKADQAGKSSSGQAGAERKPNAPRPPARTPASARPGGFGQRSAPASGAGFGGGFGKRTV